MFRLPLALAWERGQGDRGGEAGGIRLFMTKERSLPHPSLVFPLFFSAYP